MLKRILPLILLFSQLGCATKTTLTSQAKDANSFPSTVVESLHSKALDEDRLLNIYLPQGYHTDSSQTYPVIYVLDGSADEDFLHIAGIVQFMNMYQLLPHSIVVGIANVDRYRDFTYPTTVKADLESIPTAGGSEKFIQFLEKEVQPFLKKNYRTNSQSTIIGQSLGGLLATEVLLKKPEMFNDYIIVSPSLWYDEQKLITQADSIFQMNPSLQKRVFVSRGTEHPTMHEMADKLVNAIKQSGNENLKVYYEPIAEENHATIMHRAVYRAFEYLNPRNSK